MYSESFVLFTCWGFVNIYDSLAEIVWSSVAIVHTFDSKNGLVGILLDFWSKKIITQEKYLLKPRNLALTQSLTCLPADFLAILLVFSATISVIAFYDKWLINIIWNIIFFKIVELATKNKKCKKSKIMNLFNRLKAMYAPYKIRT